MKRTRGWQHWLKRTGLVLAGIAVLAAVPVLYVETQCIEPHSKPDRGAPPSELPPADRRTEVNSYLTYPEWSIVHAYEDLAAIMRRGSESDYDYFGAIRRYWSSLCSISRMASSRGEIASDYKVMLHVIGLSFAAEMGIKGLYEKTIGRLTALIRGRAPTPEDAFAQVVADDYAAFLRQVPWYEYAFVGKLRQFWEETPLVGGNIVRKVERRIALSLEWGSKALYAKAIGLGAAAAPAPLRIRSIVRGLDASDLAADARITQVGTTSTGDAIIETDRYRTLTEILAGLATRGRSFVEIAGNRNILVTVLAPPDTAVPAELAHVLFEVPSGMRPAWRRLALDVRIDRLAELMRALRTTSIELEHVYDY